MFGESCLENAAPTPSRCAKTARRVLTLAGLLVALGLRLAWASIVPFNDAPEEACHFAMADYLRRDGRPPTMADVPSRVAVSFPALPSAGYLASALASLAVPADDPRVLWFARLGNVLVGVAAAWVCFLAARELVPDRPEIALGVQWIVALWPQQVFLSAYVNNDASAALGAAAIWLLWLRAARLGLGPSLGAVLGVVIGLAALAKYNGAIVAAAGVPIVFEEWRRRPARRRTLVLGLGTMLGGAAATFAPWAVWSLCMHGSLTGLDVHEPAWLAYALEHFPEQPLLGWDNLGEFASETFRSFWAGLGFANLHLDSFAYGLLAAVCGSAAAMLLSNRRLLGARSSPGARRQQVVCWKAVAVGAVVLVLAHAHYSARHWFSPQGRYLAPLAFPAAAALAAGLSLAARRPIGRWTAVAALVGFFAWLQAESIQVERRSNRFRQPVAAVRCRLLAYHADLPGDHRARSEQAAPIGGATLVPYGGRRRFVAAGSKAGIELACETRLGATPRFVLESRTVAGPAACGRLVLRGKSKRGALLERSFGFRDPGKGVVRHVFDARSVASEFADEPVKVQMLLDPGARTIDLYRFEAAP